MFKLPRICSYDRAFARKLLREFLVIIGVSAALFAVLLCGLLMHFIAIAIFCGLAYISYIAFGPLKK